MGSLPFELRRPTLADLRQVWEWVTARPVFFPHSGGYLTWDSYLIWSRHGGRHNTAVKQGGRLISMVTVEATGNDEYLMHVTSPKRSNLETIVNSTYQVGWQLFDRLKAEMLFTHCPTIDGHLHRGSKGLCEGCGLKPYGLPEQEEIRGHRYSWQAYVMTRDHWIKEEHGRIEDNDQHQTGIIVTATAATATTGHDRWGV